MLRKNHSIIVYFFVLFSLFLFFFDIYYFFIRRDVGPAYYLNKFFYKLPDKILELTVYQDLVEEYQQLNLASKDKDYIVFVGDSITKGFNTEEFMHNPRILNRGIFSDTTFGLLQRLEKNINNISIEKLFLMIGINDLKHRDNTAIIGNIQKIIRRAQAKTKYVQSILPVNLEGGDLNERIDQINAILSANAEKENYVFLDLNSKFKDETGKMNSKYTRDGIHPNFYGYILWLSIIKQYI